MSNRNRKWSPEDDRRLLELKEAGAPLAVIAEELKRTQSAIDSRTNALKNRADPSNRWTPEEDDLFRRLAEANTRPEMIAAKLNRSVHAVKARAYTIGLPLKWFKLRAKGK